MQLKTKSFISVALITVAISFVIGYISIKNSDDILRNDLTHEIKIDSNKINNHINNVKLRLKQVSDELIQSKEVVSSLNLISNYEDKKSYNALIFDLQKSNLVNFSERFFSNESFFIIQYFDKMGNLVVQKSFNESAAQSGFITYNAQTPYFKSNKELLKVNAIPTVNIENIGTMQSEYDNNFYKLDYSLAINFNEQTVGFTKVTYFLGKEELRLLEENLIYPISFSQIAHLGDAFEATLLDAELGLYIKHHINFDYFEHKRKVLMYEIVVVTILLTLLIFLIFLIFINKEFLQPLTRLQGSMELMLHDKYKPIAINSNDEIGKIFHSTNKIFQKLWENHSSLQGYQKSIEASNLVTKTDLKGHIIYANELFCQTSGYLLQEIIGKPHNIIRDKNMESEVFEQMWSTIQKGKIWRGVIKNKTKEGGAYWADSVVSPIFDAYGQIEGYLSIRRDITELMKNKESLEFRANYDVLTGLKNRNKLHIDLMKTNNPCLILINIDRFSQINDFYGHEFGDKFLQYFSQLIQQEFKEQFKEHFKLYRYSGDEFVLLLEDYPQHSVIGKITDILEKLEKQSLRIDERELAINLSCGLCFKSAKDLLLSANMALKIAKKEKKLVVIYSEENSLNKQYENNLLWAGKLKKAIEENRVVPYFQLIVNNTNLAYEKYEALVRIVEPNGKVISPFFFLDIAKQTKQYLQLTKIMVNKSFEMFAKEEVEFSINLTIEDIVNEELREFLFRKLDENSAIAKRVVLELVESESIEDYETIIDFIATVKTKGCKIAIDDFGSGYSNFEYLIKLQADYIKIDGSLIKNINTQKESFVVVSTIVSFAKQMGIKTIAEFIEDEAIFKTIKELGIDYSQGYYFQAPQSNIKKPSYKE